MLAQIINPHKRKCVILTGTAESPLWDYYLTDIFKSEIVNSYYFWENNLKTG